MSFLKKICKKIFYVSFEISSIIKIIFQSVFYRNKIYLFGIPVHGNLGDQAILLAEEKFLKDNFEDFKIIEVESRLVVRYRKILKKIGKLTPLLIHGGGFLGSLWIQEEEMFRTVLETFPNNRIIVLPQTVYFSKDEEGQNILMDSKKIYQKHKNLIICCREQYSYQFMKKEFPLCNVMLIPDMVLYLNNVSNSIQREGTLFCIRKDKEKVKYDFEKIMKQVKEKVGNIDYTDTIIEQNIYTHRNRVKSVNKKLEQFSHYKLIITDRLHGMVFALLSNSPCLVFENKSYKVKGVYEWIKNFEYIKLYNQQNAKKQIAELLIKSDNRYNNKKLLKEYEQLIKVIKENIDKK